MQWVVCCEKLTGHERSVRIYVANSFFDFIAAAHHHHRVDLQDRAASFQLSADYNTCHQYSLQITSF